MVAEADIPDEFFEKIVTFVDGETGRKVPLTDDEEAEVRRLIDEDPSVKALVEELRAANAQLDTMLDDVAAVEVPDQLVALIRGHGAEDVAIFAPKAEGKGTSEEGDVVELKHARGSRPYYGPLAAAASVGLIISCSALLYQYSSFDNERASLETALATATEKVDGQARELADADVELQRVALLAQQASDLTQQTADELAANEERMRQLEVEQADLQGRYAALEGENQRLGTLVEQQRNDLAESETARDRAMQQLAAAEQTLSTTQSQSESDRKALLAENGRLKADLESRQQTVASLTEELITNQRLAQAASANLAKATSGQVDLERRLAEATLNMDASLAARTASDEAAAEAEQRLAAVEASQSDAEGRLATVTEGLVAAEAGRQEALQLVVGLEADLAASKSWLGQIAQYHRVYASTARRHLVEVGADERDHIQEWMTNMIGRDIPVPDLSDFGVTFAGARLLGINEKPVAQLVYLDRNDQPLALCIIPSSGDAKEASASTNRDLNLVDWRDGHFAYAVVGWSEPTLLSTLVEAIQPVYEL